MHFLHPIIQRITKDPNSIKELENLETDVEITKKITEYIPFEHLASEFQHYYGVEYIDLDSLAIDASILKKFDATVLKSYAVLPYEYEKENKTYHFAIHNFLNETLRQNIIRSSKAVGAKARFAYSPKEVIAEKYHQLETDGRVEVVVQKNIPQEIPQTTSAETDFNAQEWMSDIIDKGIAFGASDIHIERLEHLLQVRYRVDGIMTRKQQFNYPSSIISNIFVRLKVIGGMDISEKRKPQDGRIDNYEYLDQLFDLRVSTVTTIRGEKAVMRLLDKSSQILSFEQLGFSKVDTDKIDRMLHNKNGIIYIGGATGSGKTTSLYTMMDMLNDDSVNMYTIENPVEKTIENINQIQIDPLAGVTYPSTLKALLRQDPDIIVVGEIRDAETAELSVRASLTGHLVLSTIHANSAIDSISRLLNMGIEPYLIVGSSLGFLSQRLVRKLCPVCKKKHTHLNAHEEAWIQQKEEEYQLTIDPSKFYQANGCDQCTNGYKGRVAIVEIVEMTDAMKALILKKASAKDISEQAIKDGFHPLVVNGIDKVLEGTTTIDEIMRELV